MNKLLIKCRECVDETVWDINRCVVWNHWLIHNSTFRNSKPGMGIVIQHSNNGNRQHDSERQIGYIGYCATIDHTPKLTRTPPRVSNETTPSFLFSDASDISKQPSGGFYDHGLKTTPHQLSTTTAQPDI
jgi:hypothetical protein